LAGEFSEMRGDSGNGKETVEYTSPDTVPGKPN